MSGVHHPWTNEHPSASSERHSKRTSNLLLATRVASCVGLVASVARYASAGRAEASSPRLLHSVTGFAVTTQPLGIAEDALLEVRWHHDLPEVERASVRGASRRYGARYRAHGARQSSNNEPHLRAAPSAVPSNTRLLALELQNLPKRVGNGTIGHATAGAMLYHGVMSAEHVLFCTPMIPPFHEPSVRSRPFVSSARIRACVVGPRTRSLGTRTCELCCEYRACHSR